MVCIESTRAVAGPRSGHETPVFTGDLRSMPASAITLDPFAMRPAFPTSDYYGSSAPPRRHQPATDLPTGQLAADRVRDHLDGSHVHLPTVRRDRHPAMPLQHRRGYATDIHHGLPASDTNRPRSSPHRLVRVRAATRPVSARFEPVDLLRSVQSLVPHVCLSVLLAGPDPSGSTGPSRRCQGCLPPSPPSRGSGCPQLHRPAVTGRRRCPSTTARSKGASWRSVS